MVRENIPGSEKKEERGWEILYDESDVCLLACGDMVAPALEARDMMKWNGANCSLIDCGSGRILDRDMLRTAAGEHVLLVTVEAHAEAGGFGEMVRSFLDGENLQPEMELIAMPDEYAQEDPAGVSRREAGLDAENLYHRIQTRMIGLIR